MAEKDMKFEIVEHLKVLSEGSKGWTKEINLVQWYKNPLKLDIREWDEKHEKMGKGITLNMEELKVLKEFLLRVDLEELGVD